jgi:hypothetical protein
VLPPIVFMGDFNVDPRDGSQTLPTYQLLIRAGFVDAWTQVNPGRDGFTCCQAADLLNTTSALSFRPDLMLTRGVSVENIKPWAINREPIPPSGRPTMLDYWLRSKLANKAGGDS